MSIRIVGACGNCGGTVTLPTSYMGIYPPTPTCDRCGSTPVSSNPTVLPMNPRPNRENAQERAIKELQRLNGDVK